MVKRRVLSEDLSSDDDYCSAGPSSSLPPSSKRTSNPAKKTAKPAKKRTKPTPDSDGTILETMARTHSINMHAIACPRPVREALLKWYSSVHETRGMPWRKPFDASLDSDGRAQRAYEASSDIEQVNALWKGLGYYSRAARLLAGAQKCVQSSELCGRLPNNAKDMQALIPGIGRYSAGAICSIAYGEKVPVLDGNVTRLMSRILALHAPITAKSTLNLLWRAAETMVELSDHSADNEVRKEGDAGDINQALIELGSTVCKVKEPLCNACPVQEWCGAYKLANSSISEHIPDMEDLCNLCEALPVPIAVIAFPMKAEKKKAREEVDHVSVIEWRSRRSSHERWFLLVRRPEGGLLAGLHEFPTTANVPADSSSANMQAMEAHGLITNLLVAPLAPYRSSKSKFFEPKHKQGDKGDDLRIADIRAAGDVPHVFSHIKKTYRVQWVLLEGGEETPPALAPTKAAVAPVVTAPKGKGAVGKVNKNAKTSGKDLGGSARWLPLEDVADAKPIVTRKRVGVITEMAGRWQSIIRTPEGAPQKGFVADANDSYAIGNDK
ncbi:hypothetical protein HWV62_18796 [Athelia sp. TMB]|nr:hypothetical protein HWV62_18796 [Athelia sp. TMB]